MAYGQDAEVKSLVSVPETTVGVPVDFSIAVSSVRGNISFDLPEAKKYSAADIGLKQDPKVVSEEDQKLPLYVVDAVEISDLSTAGTFRKTVKVKVLYYAPGNYTIPPFAVKEDGRIVKFDVPHVTVKAVNESGEVAGVEPPLALGGNHTRIFLLIIFAVFLGAAGFGLWKWWRVRRSIAPPAAPERPAIEIFMGKVKTIRASLSDESVAPDLFALELSMAFRRFISSMYGFDAAEMTSRELLDSIVAKRKGLTAERYGSQLEGIMALWDMTKFAEFNPSAETLRINLKDTVFLAEKMWRDIRGL
jgi:hypothetical protein